MNWKEWIKDKSIAEIMQVQVPHNATYWIRHRSACANGEKCPHVKRNAKTKISNRKMQHHGQGYCLDCYMELGLGSGKVKIPGPNKRIDHARQKMD